MGGRSAESIIEVKNNALAYFQAQQRAVTKEDYIARIYALPPKYGNIAKAYIVQDSQLDSSSGANSDGCKVQRYRRVAGFRHPRRHQRIYQLADDSAALRQRRIRRRVRHRARDA